MEEMTRQHEAEKLWLNSKGEDEGKYVEVEE